MDKNKIEEQIASLEASHKEEVQKLRDSLKLAREPKVGDVYSFGDSNVILDSQGFNINILKDGLARIGDMTHAEIEADYEFKFIGKFSDVFFTKDQIEKMLLENLQTMRDWAGDEFKVRHEEGWHDVRMGELEKFISNLVKNKNRDGSEKS